MIGPSAPVSSADQFAQTLAAYEARIADLERAFGRYRAGSLAAHSLATVFNTAAVHTTMQDEGLTVTVADVAGRRYKWTLALNLYIPGGANGVLVQLLRSAAILRVWSLPVEALSTTASHAVTLTHTELIAASVGSSPYKVQIAASTNNTQVTSHGAATVLRQLIVEDIGV